MGLGCASYKDIIGRGRRRRILQDWAFSLASSDDRASQLRKSKQRKAQSATSKCQAGRQSTGDNGVRKFGVDKGVRKFDVSAKTKRAFRICLPTAFNLCPTAGDDQTVVRRFLEDAELH